MIAIREIPYKTLYQIPVKKTNQQFNFFKYKWFCIFYIVWIEQKI